jgi:hypothetical protein
MSKSLESKLKEIIGHEWDCPYKNKECSCGLERKVKTVLEVFLDLIDEVIGEDDRIVDHFYDPEIEGTVNGFLRMQGARMVKVEQR